jgi:hypothetical protein
MIIYILGRAVFQIWKLEREALVAKKVSAEND